MRLIKDYKILKIVCFTIINLYSNLKSFSQPVIISLKEAESLTMGNNTRIIETESGVESARMKFEFAKSLNILPTFEMNFVIGPITDAKGNVIYSPTKADEFGPVGPFYRYDLNIIQPIYTFGKISGVQDAAKAGIDVAKSQKSIVEDTVITEIRKLFFLYQTLKATLQFFNEIDSSLQKLKDKMNELLKAGKGEVTETDLLKVKTFEAYLKGKISETNSNIDRVYKTLKVSIGISYEFTLKEEDFDWWDYKIKDENYYAQNLIDKKPEIKTINSAIDALMGEKTSISGKLFPDLYLGAKFGYAYTPGREDQKNPFVVDEFNYIFLGAVVGLKQDLGFYQNIMRLKEINARIEQLKKKRDAILDGVTIEVSSYYTMLKGYLDKKKYLEDGLKSSKTLFTGTLLNYEMGTEDISNVIDAFKDYIGMKTEYIQTINNYNTTLSELLRASGCISEFWEERNE